MYIMRRADTKSQHEVAVELDSESPSVPDRSRRAFGIRRARARSPPLIVAVSLIPPESHCHSDHVSPESETCLLFLLTTKAGPQSVPARRETLDFADVTWTFSGGRGGGRKGKKKKKFKKTRSQKIGFFFLCVPPRTSTPFFVTLVRFPRGMAEKKQPEDYKGNV